MDFPLTQFWGWAENLDGKLEKSIGIDPTLSYSLRSGQRRKRTRDDSTVPDDTQQKRTRLETHTNISAAPKFDKGGSNEPKPVRGVKRSLDDGASPAAAENNKKARIDGQSLLPRPSASRENAVCMSIN